MKIRTLLSLTVLILLLFLLVSCESLLSAIGGTSDTPQTTAEAQTTGEAQTKKEPSTAAPVTSGIPTTAPATTTAPTTTTPPPTDLVIPYGDLGAYTLVMTDDSEEGDEAALNFVDAVARRTGVTLAMSSVIGSDDGKQIVVADATEVGLMRLRYHDYMLYYSETSVYLLVGSAEAREQALAYLLTLFASGRLTVPEAGYTYSHTYEIGEITLNGEDLSSYELLATEASRPYLEELQAYILEKSGYLLPLTEETLAKTISLTVTAGEGSMQTTVTVDGQGITLSGNGKNAMHYSVCAFLDFMETSTEEGRIAMTVEERLTLSNKSYAAPSAGAFYAEDGTLDRDGDGEIHIVFIGGSLTQNNQVWCPPVVEYFREQFPNKTVTYTNAAIGATDSTMGAIRFRHDVLDKVSPDIVFVEYAVNDAGYTRESDYMLKKNGVYVESIIRQCLAHENQPAVVLLNFPRGFEPGSDAWRNWEGGVDLKERIAANYGVKTVNVLDYVTALYDTQKATNPSLTYSDFLLQYYNAADMVHPTSVGYAVFRDAILAALAADFEGFLTNRTDADLYLSDYRREILTKWELIPLAGPDIRLEGNIVRYEALPSYKSDDPRHIPSGSLDYPRFTDGILQVEDGSSFTITVDARANVIGIYGLHSPAGMSVDIYNDDTGAKLGTVNTKENHTRPLLVTLTQDTPRRLNTYRIVPSGSNTAAETVFRMGYLVIGTYPAE